MASDEAGELAAALPGYDIGGELGRGAFGVVLAGRHRQLGRQVAIKQLPRAFSDHPEVRHRFSAEAKILASLDHPHIVPIFDYVEQGGLCVLVMELLPGGTVRQRQAHGLNSQAVCAIGLAACSALDYAHQRGVLHRDVKPDNMLFTSAGLLKVTDFGIAKVVGDVAVTLIGETPGTPMYMAPEQCLDQPLSPATDVYATGVMLYELLCGHHPFEGSRDLVSTMYRQIHEDARPLRMMSRAVPETLEPVIMRALTKDPAARYRSARAFGGALAEAAVAAWGDTWPAGEALRIMSVGPIEAATGWPLTTGPVDIGIRPEARAADSRDTVYFGETVRVAGVADDWAVATSGGIAGSVIGGGGPGGGGIAGAGSGAGMAGATGAGGTAGDPQALRPTVLRADPGRPPGSPGSAVAATPASPASPPSAWAPAQSGPPLLPTEPTALWSPAPPGPPPAPSQTGLEPPAARHGAPWPSAPAEARWRPEQPDAGWRPEQPEAPMSTAPTEALWPPKQHETGWQPEQAEALWPEQAVARYPPPAISGTAPPAPTSPSPRRRRAVLVVLAITVVAIAAVGGVLALTKKRAATPAGGTTVQPSDTASPAEQAADLNQLLQESAGARTQIVTTVASIQDCSADLETAAQALASAIMVRQQVVTSLARLSVAALPNGAALRLAMTTGLDDSVDADHDFQAWLAGITAAGGCNGQAQAPHDANWQAAQTASSAATSAKQTFANLWNPVATSYGLPKVSSATI